MADFTSKVLLCSCGEGCIEVAQRSVLKRGVRLMFNIILFAAN